MGTCCAEQVLSFPLKRRLARGHGPRASPQPQEKQEQRGPFGDPGLASITLGRPGSPPQGSWPASDPRAAHRRGAGPEGDCSEVPLLQAEEDPGLARCRHWGISLIRIVCMPALAGLVPHPSIKGPAQDRQESTARPILRQAGGREGAPGQMMAESGNACALPGQASAN